MASVKTRHTFDNENGYRIRRTLTRRFNTLEEANRFAEGKDVNDIYRSKGMYVVEYVKTTADNGEWSIKVKEDGKEVFARYCKK